MNKLIILALLAVPAGVFAQEASRPELLALPGVDEMRAEAMESADPVRRPDASGIMAEISSALRLSSKQEERIAAAVGKKAVEFDKLMKDHDKSAAEEKKWRYKMNESRHAMQTINRDLPDTVRDFLDDEQRQSYDEMIAAKKKPAPAPAAPAVEPARPAGVEGAVRPLKKKRVLRRRKLPPAGAAAPAAVPADEEEAGQVMVDKEPGAAQPAPRKKRVMRRKAPAAAPAAEPAAEDVMANEPAGAKPTGQEAPAEEDAGSYP